MGALTLSASAAFCSAGSSGITYGIIMFHDAITHARARTSYSLPDERWMDCTRR